MLFLGTRPEAIKLCPVIRYFRDHCADSLDVRVCVTAQHRAMLDQVLQVFGIEPEYDLDVMRPGQTLTSATSFMLSALEPVLQNDRPDLVLVQGDTATTLCGALAAFYARIPVGHVEAGLRTGDMTQPFPEEMNRVVVGRLTSLHFAATPWAAANLRAEGVHDSQIAVTGNTGIDAVLYVRDRLERNEISGRDWSNLDPERKLIVVTAHRRESFGHGFEQISTALRQIADLPNVQLVYPVHPNPNVTEPIRRNLTGHPHIQLIEPLDYVSFVDLMRRAYLIAHRFRWYPGRSPPPWQARAGATRKDRAPGSRRSRNRHARRNRRRQNRQRSPRAHRKAFRIPAPQPYPQPLRGRQCKRTDSRVHKS